MDLLPSLFRRISTSCQFLEDLCLGKLERATLAGIVALGRHAHHLRKLKIAELQKCLPPKNSEETGAIIALVSRLEVFSIKGLNRWRKEHLQLLLSNGIRLQELDMAGTWPSHNHSFLTKVSPARVDQVCVRKAVAGFEDQLALSELKRQVNYIVRFGTHFASSSRFVLLAECCIIAQSPLNRP